MYDHEARQPLRSKKMLSCHLLIVQIIVGADHLTDWDETKKAGSLLFSLKLQILINSRHIWRIGNISGGIINRTSGK
ncbi:hypothetical protein GE061_020301 [Apolygus lucorum]|uniref:Uncharacterized protein n=1 Tax=Apolygus lucorum TaxID=248454 RepID=A0A8S9WIU8_APOLU|nr:hypothetical protein GE061_020300 [Apolygus lucorum]KAF6197343.1 hypothetical protein GE061_020301 [Apolygus lucorum]